MPLEAAETRMATVLPVGRLTATVPVLAWEYAERTEARADTAAPGLGISAWATVFRVD